ncbi:MAG: alpha/beta hydrolase [Planctomycetota bacterium]
MPIRNRPIIMLPALFVLGGCSIPGPTVSRAERAEIESFIFDAPLDVGPTRLRGFRGGDESLPRVVYVHGTPGDALNWADFLVDPVAGTESVAFDRPGFGGSEPRGAVVRLSDQAKALEPLLERHSERGTILVGHSYGAPVVVQAALQYPNRVDGIVLVAGSLDPALEKTLTIQKVGDSPYVRPLLPRWVQNFNRELIFLEPELRTLQEQLGSLSLPIEIVHGTSDKQVPYSNVDFMQTAFTSEPTVTTIDNGNHFVPWQNADTIRAAVARILEQPPAVQPGRLTPAVVEPLPDENQPNRTPDESGSGD